MFGPTPPASPARQSQNHDRSARRIAAVVAVVAAATALSTTSARAQSCPAPLADAKRLVLVTAETMNDTAATMRLYERASARESWRALGAAEPALIGRGGMGWSQFFPPARAPRRADQGRGRQARAGRHLCDRPELRHRRVVAAELSSGHAGHDLRQRSVVAGLQHHRFARPARARGQRGEHEQGVADVPARPAGELSDRREAESRIVHLHPRLALAHDRHRRLRRDARAARRGVAGVCRRRRRARDPAARRARSAAGCVPGRRTQELS